MKPALRDSIVRWLGLAAVIALIFIVSWFIATVFKVMFKDVFQ